MCTYFYPFHINFITSTKNLLQITLLTFRYEWYATLELQLGNVERVRQIYEKFIEKHPDEPQSWKLYIDLEVTLGEVDRARELCEMWLNIPEMQAPEILWKRYIQLEIDLENFDGWRAIYERLLEKTEHIRVYRTYWEFEISEWKDWQKWISIYDRGIQLFKDQQMSERR